MVSPNSKPQNLSSFCQTRSSFKTRVALLTFYKTNYSIWTQRFLLIIEYLQLLSQAVLSSTFSYSESNRNEFIFEIIIYCFKLINPCYLLTYENSDSYTTTVLVLLFFCALLKIALFSYVLYASRWNKTMNRWLVTLWKWIYLFQTRVLYYLFTSFWIKTILEVKSRDYALFGMSNAPMIFISCLMLVLELFFSLALETQLCYFLPTRNFLSSKNNHLQLTTFFQKFIIQVTMLIWQDNSTALPWITSIIALIMGIMKLYDFFSTLPLYYFKALELQGGLLSTVIALNLACFMRNILDSADYEGGASVNFVIITWILLSLLTVKITNEALKSRISRLLGTNCTLQNSSSSPDVLLHKVIATMQLKDMETLPANEMRSNYQLPYLESTNQNINIEQIFGVDLLDEFEESSGKISDEALTKVFLLYFENLLTKFPDHLLVKLHTAHTYFKSSEPYTKILKIINEIEDQNRSKWSSSYLSPSLLLYEVEKTILADHNHNMDSKNLDLFTYIKSKIHVDDLRKKMLEQTELSLQVCENILTDTSDIGQIYSNGQKISKLRGQIQKYMDNLQETIPDYYVAPFLYCAEYHLITNYSVSSFERYSSMFVQKYANTERFFKELHLVEENLYQESNVFLLLSLQKSTHGNILFCDKSISNLFGGQTKGYQGSHISRLLPPSLNSYYESCMKAGGLQFMNKVHRGFLSHHDKYLVETEFCFKYHPFLAQGLCLNLMIRPVPNSGDYLLINENGDVEGGSRKITKRLKLDRNLVNIRHLSEELSEANKAINMVLRGDPNLLASSPGTKNTPEKGMMLSTDQSRVFFSHGSSTAFKSQMSLNKAQEIYFAYTEAEEDQKVFISPFKEDGEADGRKNHRQPKEVYPYYCRIQILSYGNMKLKLVTLQRDSASSKGRTKTLLGLGMEESTRHQFEPKSILRWPTKTSKKTLKNDDSMTSENFDDIEEETFPKGRSISTHLHLEPVFSFSPRTALFSDRPLISEAQSPREGGTPLASVIFTQQALLTTEKELSPPKQKRNVRIEITDVENPLSKNQNGGDNINITTLAVKKDQVLEYISSQGSSQKPADNVANKAFKRAILAKSSPRSFIVLCIVFYGVISLTFVAQILMKVVSDDTMKDLQTKKDLLKNSQERSYKAALIQINALGAGLQVLGAFSQGADYVGVVGVIENLQTRAQDMKTANVNMLNNVYSLGEDIQSQLFERDVRNYGTYLDPDMTKISYQTTFQVAQELVNAVEALEDLEKPTSMEGYYMFQYLAMNVMDDFQFKSNEITDVFTASLEDQKVTYQNIMNLCLILTLVLLASIGTLLLVIIWNQYRIGKKNLKAFIKIRPSGVKDISNRLTKFKNNLVNEEILEGKWLINMSENLDLLSHSDKNSTYSKKHNAQIILYKSFRQRYSRYLIRVVLYISIMIAFTIWNLIHTHKDIKDIYNKQSQLQFANYISSRVTAGYASFPILFISNNTMYVEHKIALQALLDAETEAKTIQSEISKQFQDQDGNYNSEVQKILFNNKLDCADFPSDNRVYCTSLKNLGQPVNMVSAMAVYQSVLANKYKDFLNADKTSKSTLLTAAYLNIATLLPNFVVITHEAQVIADLMDEIIDKKVEEDRDSRSITIGVFAVFLVFVGILIWIKILRVLREVHNDFKKVLQIFPPGLILSSFLLKRFLQRTSNERLRIVEN